MISCQFAQSRLRISIAIGRADRLARAHAGEELRGVPLDLHAASAAVALLAASEVRVDVRRRGGGAGGHALEDADKGLAMGFACGGEAEHR